MAGATLRDVARRAGVSIRTVSNVVNASVPVSDELRIRVEVALEELDYRPNLVARNLRHGRTGMLALVVPELDVPYFAELAREIITAAREATAHLAAMGCRRIAAIGDQPYSTGETAQLRTIGYRQALERAGLSIDESLIVSTPHFHRGFGAQAMRQLLALPEPPDAVFCYNDLLAIGAMHALTERGVRVPDDVAVVGVDGIQEGEYSSPTLTTIAPDKAALARTAVGTLVAVIEGTAPPPSHAKAPYRLVVRGSTARV
jgi:DNA-binding LacI/PurR family transcriptional regulator